MNKTTLELINDEIMALSQAQMSIVMRKEFGEVTKSGKDTKTSKELKTRCIEYAKHIKILRMQRKNLVHKKK